MSLMEQQEAAREFAEVDDFIDVDDGHLFLGHEAFLEMLGVRVIHSPLSERILHDLEARP